MPVPSNFSDLDTNANNNSPPGSESAKGNIDNYLRAGFAFIRQLYNGAFAPSVTIASAASVAIGSAQSTNIVITGTTAITSFDIVPDGVKRDVTFSGALVLTHNATSLILPGAANITTAAGDTATFLSLGSGNWRCIKYQQAAYSPAGAFAPGTAMLFQQTAAPTGWTKQTTHNNKALRVVSGTAGSGGTVAFTTAFASQAVSGSVGNTTLSIAQIPSHDHTGGMDTVQNFIGGSSGAFVHLNSQPLPNTGLTGGGGAHNHSFTGTNIDLSVQYVDLIIATKD